MKEEVRVFKTEKPEGSCPFCGGHCEIIADVNGIDWQGCKHLLKAEGLRHENPGFLFFLTAR